jgi:hypothetical protein
VNLVAALLGYRSDICEKVNKNLMTVKISKYKLDSVVAQKVRWDGGGIGPTGQYTFLYGKGNQNHELGTGHFSN